MFDESFDMHKKELKLLLSNMNDENPYKKELSQILMVPKTRLINKSIERGSTPISDVRSSKKVNPNDLKKKIEIQFKQAHLNRTAENFKNKKLIDNELNEENGEHYQELKTININNKRKTAGIGFNGYKNNLYSSDEKDNNKSNKKSENTPKYINKMYDNDCQKVNDDNLKTEASITKGFKTYATTLSDKKHSNINETENEQYTDNDNESRSESESLSEQENLSKNPSNHSN